MKEILNKIRQEILKGSEFYLGVKKLIKEMNDGKNTKLRRIAEGRLIEKDEIVVIIDREIKNLS